jgi:cytochrome P450
MSLGAQLDEWPVPAPPEDSVQARMARFSEGADHARRRAIAEARLAALAPDDLRVEARAQATALLSGRDEVDVMAELARTVPVAVLARALGVAGPDVVVAVAATRRLCLALAPPEGTEPADGRPEVATLAGLLGMGDDPAGEEAVNVVALLFQAMDATAGLIGNALRAGDGPPPVTVVRTFRVGPDGNRCAVDLDDVDPPLPFGAGHHRCPGEAHARALTAGVLDALADAGAAVVDADPADEPRANLRVPVRVVVRLPR